MPTPASATTRECPACRRAHIEVMAVSATDPRLFLACPNCGTGFWAPDLRERFPVAQLGEGVEPATRDEVLRAGWAHLLG